jgi:hypothetical protein
MYCDLTLSSFKDKCYLTLVHIDSPVSMSGACRIFGQTFGVSVRNRAPNTDENPVSQCYADVVNLVDVADNGYDDAARVQEDQLTEFVTALGVDFLYDQRTRLLKIHICYRKLDIHMPVVASTLNIDCLEPSNIANVNPNRWVQHLRPGKYFATCDGQMVLLRYTCSSGIY